MSSNSSRELSASLLSLGSRRGAWTGALLVAASISACHPRPAASSAASAPQVSTPAKSPTARPRWLVALVVDQLAARAANDKLAELPADGGFARLRREGRWYRDMRFAHAITETAPGHASLFTGKTPHEHGIVANEVLDASGKSQGILADPEAKLLDVHGLRSEGGAASLRALRAVTFASLYRQSFPSGRVLALSLKDRGAAFGADAKPELVAWYEPGLPGVVTSNAFATVFPAALTQFSNQTESRFSEIWQPLDPAWLGKHASIDDQPGESDLGGYGRVFPHDIRRSNKPGLAFRAHPVANTWLVDLTIAALEANHEPRPTLLTVSFSTNDYVGHLFGADSQEAWDQLRRLDAELARLFAYFDKKVGKSGWSAVLSADHGIGVLPELSRHAHPDGHGADSPSTQRIVGDKLLESARKAADADLGKGNWVAGIVAPYLYLSTEARSLEPAKRARLEQVLVKTLTAKPGILRLFDVRQAAATCPDFQDETIEALVCRSLSPGRGGDYYIATAPGAVFALTPDASGMNHGSHAVSDRSVPLLVREADGAGAGSETTETIPFTRYFETLERWRGQRVSGH